MSHFTNLPRGPHELIFTKLGVSSQTWSTASNFSTMIQGFWFSGGGLKFPPAQWLRMSSVTTAVHTRLPNVTNSTFSLCKHCTGHVLQPMYHIIIIVVASQRDHFNCATN